MGRLYDALDMLLAPNNRSPLCFRPEDMPDLTLAYLELHKLANNDGDIGAAYWNSVIKLLRWAEDAHQEQVVTR